MEKIILTGKINKEIYYNSETSYGVYSFYTESNIQSDGLNKHKYSDRWYGTIIGNMQRLEIGCQYIMEVNEVFDRKYKKIQFESILIYEQIPKTRDQKEVFLNSILTETQTKTVLDAYPDFIENIMDGVELDLSLLNGIKEYRFALIKEKVIDSYILTDLLLFLSPYGITYKEVKEISSICESVSDVKEMILDNPYVLVKKTKLKFGLVDSVAINISDKFIKSKERLIAFLEYQLKMQESSKGDTWINSNKLYQMVEKRVMECSHLFKKLLIDEVEKPTFLHIEGDKVGSLYSYNTEIKIFKELNRINSSLPKFIIPTNDIVELTIKEVERNQGFELSEEQKETMYMLPEEGNVLIVSGSSGSGKSTAINTICEILDTAQVEEDISISQMALSAKASIRMHELTNRPSSTIHKFLFEQKEDFSEVEEKIMIDCEPEYDGRGNIYIIDEFSMVNIYLTLKVLEGIPSGSMIIFVFDYAQLPAIGAGAIAYDLLEYSGYKKSKYTEVHRQGRDSGILIDANIIKTQVNPLKKYEKAITTGKNKDMTYLFRNSEEDIRNLAIKTFISGVKKFGVDNINIITPRKKDVINSSRVLNKKIQDILIPSGSVDEYLCRITDISFRVGDKVIHKSNMAKDDVFNGEIGTVIQADNNKDSELPLTVFFKYGNIEKTILYSKDMTKSLELAYALTVHSYQGSENTAILVVLDNNGGMLLDNTMLYTAITRAKDRCVVISNPQAFQKCIDNHNTLRRNTWSSGIYKNGVEY